jgi:hypothetical protein
MTVLQVQSLPALANQRRHTFLHFFFLPHIHSTSDESLQMPDFLFVDHSDVTTSARGERSEEIVHVLPLTSRIRHNRA